jgi:hypothetical protein
MVFINMNTLFNKILPVIILVLISIQVLPAQSSKKELGTRYLKLANTYREAGDWKNAEKYIQKGLELAGQDEYWKAVAFEYMGYVERDRAFEKTPVDRNGLSAARNYMADAYDIYDRIIVMEEGSPTALRQLELEKQKIDNYLGGNSSVYNASDYSANSNTLNYDGQKLKDFPDDVPPSAVNLSLQNNKLKAFPSELARLGSLRYLNLSVNKIKQVSSSIGMIGGLEWLDLSDNRINDLPNEIAMLSDLEILDLSDNKLKDLPSAMCRMQGLKVLDISGNKLEFERIKNLIQCLPNTNIIHDKYEREDEGSSNNLIFGQPSPDLPLNTDPVESIPSERRP